MERRVDNLGRIVIPAKMRRKLGVGIKDTVYIGIEDDVIIVTKEGVENFVDRKIDQLGRIIIPLYFRKKLSIANGAVMDCVLNGDVVKLSRSKVCCIMCGASTDVKDVKTVRICQNCIDEIKTGHFWEAE